MHRNKAYRPWFVAWILEFSYGLAVVGVIVMATGWSYPTLVIGGALLSFGGIVAAIVSLLQSKREEKEFEGK